MQEGRVGVVDLESFYLIPPRGPEERPSKRRTEMPRARRGVKQSWSENASTISTETLWAGLIAIAIHFPSLWLHPRGCGISVPCAGMEPVSPVLEAWSHNHWVIREISFFNTLLHLLLLSASVTFLNLCQLGSLFAAVLSTWDSFLYTSALSLTPSSTETPSV